MVVIVIVRFLCMTIIHSVNEGDPLLLDDPIRQFERSEGEVSPCVKGRLHNSLYYWEFFLKASAPIISIIRQGYYAAICICARR